MKLDISCLAAVFIHEMNEKIINYLVLFQISLFPLIQRAFIFFFFLAVPNHLFGPDRFEHKYLITD